MSDFIRARSAEQKEQRMADIKAVAARLFETHPYHQITLTTIADELGWSRANLYQYVTTKEEIFLLLMGDLRDAYTADLLQALSQTADGTQADARQDARRLADAWAQVVARHETYFRYGDLLYTVIETNVSVEKLVDFKRGYYEGLGPLSRALSTALGVREGDVPELVNTVYHHAVGVAGSCLNNPLVQQAVRRLGIEPARPDFQARMRDFITMCVEWYRAR